MIESELPELLDVLGAPAHLEIIEERQEILRLAESAITYQHSEQRELVRIRIIRGERAVWATTTSHEPEKFRELRQRLESVLERLPPGGQVDLAATETMSPPPRTFFESTDLATPTDRANLLKRAIRTVPANVRS